MKCFEEKLDSAAIKYVSELKNCCLSFDNNENVVSSILILEDCFREGAKWAFKQINNI